MEEIREFIHYKSQFIKNSKRSFNVRISENFLSSLGRGSLSLLY